MCFLFITKEERKYNAHTVKLAMGEVAKEKECVMQEFTVRVSLKFHILCGNFFIKVRTNCDINS